MTYLDYLNRFDLWLECNTMEMSAQMMYYKLLSVFNRAGWPEAVRVDNRRLMVMMHNSAESTIIRARDKLTNAGFIRYRKGSKGKPTCYTLLEVQIGLNYASKNASISASKSASENASISASHIKTKRKEKELSPKPPKGADDGFGAFWDAYPKKVGKGAARKAWDKLKPDVALQKAILDAVERQKLSDQWQKDGGQFIPNPATWLNQQRLEDELGGAEPDPDLPDYTIGELLPDERVPIEPGMTAEEILKLMP